MGSDPVPLHMAKKTKDGWVRAYNPQVARIYAGSQGASLSGGESQPPGIGQQQLYQEVRKRGLRADWLRV